MHVFIHETRILLPLSFYPWDLMFPLFSSIFIPCFAAEPSVVTISLNFKLINPAARKKINFLTDDVFMLVFVSTSDNSLLTFSIPTNRKAAWEVQDWVSFKANLKDMKRNFVDVEKKYIFLHDCLDSLWSNPQDWEICPGWFPQHKYRCKRIRRW